MHNQQFLDCAGVAGWRQLHNNDNNNTGLQYSHRHHLCPLKQAAVVLVLQIKISAQTKVLFSLIFWGLNTDESHIFLQRYFAAYLMGAIVTINCAVLFWHFYSFVKLSIALNLHQDVETVKFRSRWGTAEVLAYCRCSCKWLLTVFSFWKLFSLFKYYN